MNGQGIEAADIVMMGKCKLCLRDAVSLQDSHYLPKGIFKILRDDGWDNPNPWKLTKKMAVQTSKQQTAYLLCKECEQLLNKKGEAWVLKHCLRKNGEFRLASILAARKPDLSSNDTPTKVYYASNISEINISALAYFAASIFWRGSIYRWKDDGSIPVNLGPFREKFREYLMDLKPFPRDCCLLLAVREGDEFNRLTASPVSKRKDNYHVHTFPMPGLGFALAVGKNIPANHREKCFVHGSGNPIIVTQIIEPILEEGSLKLLNEITDRKRFDQFLVK